MKPFLRASNVWRLLGLVLVVLSAFVTSGQIPTPWGPVSVFGGAGIGLIFAPTILEGIKRWRGHQ